MLCLLHFWFAHNMTAAKCLPQGINHKWSHSYIDFRTNVIFNVSNRNKLQPTLDCLAQGLGCTGPSRQKKVLNGCLLLLTWFCCYRLQYCCSKPKILRKLQSFCINVTVPMVTIVVIMTSLWAYYHNDEYVIILRLIPGPITKEQEAERPWKTDEGFQLIMMKQTEALAELNASPKLKVRIYFATFSL